MTLNKCFVALIVIALTALCSVVFVSAQDPLGSPEKTREVKVYFAYENSEGPLKSGELYPLKRRVSLIAPLQGALSALVEDPTAEETKLGYYSTAYTKGMRLASAKIKRGIAYAYFTRPPMDGNPPDLRSLSFADAVTRTAKQFPNVKKVVVCVNGMNEFGIGLVEDAPSRCPKEVK